MIEDFGGQGETAKFDCDVCIVGAGAAGVTLARRLSRKGLDIIVLESGGRDFEPDTQALADGGNDGFEYYPLKDSRLRLLGGTTAIWGGRVAELDSIDFEARSWVRHSGWPFSKQALRDYYREARASLSLPDLPSNRLEDWDNPLDPDKLKSAFWQFDPVPDRFALTPDDELVMSNKVRILLHANLTGLEMSEAGNVVEAVRFASLHGRQGQLVARQVVLAAGGIENPRLLLALTAPGHPNGIGNNHDLVGRFFMEHPHARGGQVETGNVRALFRTLPRFMRRNGVRYGQLFRPGTRSQRDLGLLNTAFSLGVRRHADQTQARLKTLYNHMRHELHPTHTNRKLWRFTRTLSTFAQDHFGPQLDAQKARNAHSGVYTVFRAEQAPNPDSRVRLGTRRDRLGLREPVLDWRFCEQDKHSVAGTMTLLDCELRRLGHGRTKFADWLEETERIWSIDPLISNHPIAGYHHMGTTRMADSPRHGVTNAHGRVHGVKNLYVAGSSLFPTSGWANPTLTILALAMRQADHIAGLH